LNWNDYGARMYDSQLGRMHLIDPKAELYFNWTPYNYALNTPVNAIDPDGNLVIFINGNHNGEGGSSDYWRGTITMSHDVNSSPFPGVTFNDKHYFEQNREFDTEVLKHFNDRTEDKYYLDGALGGFIYTPTDPRGQAGTRFFEGLEKGQEQVADMIKSLARSGGVITESIKIVTHSMGAAYAKGYILAIVEYAKAHPDECRGLSISEYDFAAFQQNQLSAIQGTSLFQYDNEGDNAVDFAIPFFGSEHAKQKGAEVHEKDVNPDGGHNLMDFINVINSLPEGTYKFINGEFVKQ
jgi:hypothetical protein